jgi:hypothetical protein
MAVMTEDTRSEEAYQEKGSGTNMCEFWIGWKHEEKHED